MSQVYKAKDVKVMFGGVELIPFNGQMWVRPIDLTAPIEGTISVTMEGAPTWYRPGVLPTARDEYPAPETWDRYTPFEETLDCMAKNTPLTPAESLEVRELCKRGRSNKQREGDFERANALWKRDPIGYELAAKLGRDDADRAVNPMME